MSDFIAQRVLIVGLGLIGGSFAGAIKKSNVCRTVLGNSRDPGTLIKAVDLGFIDRGNDNLSELLNELEENDVVVISTPTLSVKRVFEQLHKAVSRGVVVTDVASVKGSVVEDARAVFGAVPVKLVPAHPIAGSERSGISAANPQMFMRREVILTPLETTQNEAADLVARLWQAVGARVSFMSVREHDSVLALTSHLPHMLAFTLVDLLAQTPLRDEIFRYTAGGFRDFTRIAGSDPDMWHDIALANQEAVLASLDGFLSHMSHLRLAIAESDGEYLQAMFRRAQKARDNFSTRYAWRMRDDTGE